MPTRVRFRLNKITGEVEEFIIDDQDRNLPEAEHDRIAADVAGVIARRPVIREMDGTAAPPSETRRESPDNEKDRERDPDKPAREDEP